MGSIEASLKTNLLLQIGSCKNTYVGSGVRVQDMCLRIIGGEDFVKSLSSEFLGAAALHNRLLSSICDLPDGTLPRESYLVCIILYPLTYQIKVNTYI